MLCSGIKTCALALLRRIQLAVQSRQCRQSTVYSTSIVGVRIHASSLGTRQPCRSWHPQSEQYAAVEVIRFVWSPRCRRRRVEPRARHSRSVLSLHVDDILHSVRPPAPSGARGKRPRSAFATSYSPDGRRSECSLNDTLISVANCCCSRGNVHAIEASSFVVQRRFFSLGLLTQQSGCHLCNVTK